MRAAAARQRLTVSEMSTDSAILATAGAMLANGAPCIMSSLEVPVMRVDVMPTKSPRAAQLPGRRFEPSPLPLPFFGAVRA